MHRHDGNERMRAGMQDPGQMDAFVAFMAEYTDFLGRMRLDENGKLAALSSRELPRIESSIATSQANAKQLENYETKRMTLQADAGLQGLSFRQVIESAPPDAQRGLWFLFDRFERTVADIRFLNDKSMAMARDNMIDIDPEAVLPGAGAAGGSNPYEKLRRERAGHSAILETKV